MARGPSGRLVIEIDPSLKNRLHARLATEGVTLKQWVIEQAAKYLTEPLQQRLPFGERGPEGTPNAE